MRFKNVDFLRFIFAVLIVMLHGKDIIALPHYLDGISRCNVCVDFFFLIAGFFLFSKLKTDTDTLAFAEKRFWRLAPNNWFAVISAGILSIFIKDCDWDFTGNILRVLLLNCIGFAPVTGGTNAAISWFISALFWTSIFYFYISKIFEKKYLNLIIWLIVVICFSIVMQRNNFNIGGTIVNDYLILNIGICRALASMGLGYFVCMAYNYGFLKNAGYYGKIIISVLEIFIAAFLIYYIIFSPELPGNTGMCYIAAFTVLFYFMLIKKGIISKLLDNKLSEQAGKYSYSIYCFHGVILPVFEHCIFKHYSFLLNSNPLSAYLIQTFSAVCFGIILYYIFERPFSNYIENKLPHTQNKNF